MKFEMVGTEIGKLVDEKNAAYGDSFAKSGEIVRLLYPDGIKLEQVDDMLAIVRILDKLFRIATKKDAFGESPFRDIAGYGILGAARGQNVPVATTPVCGSRSAFDQSLVCTFPPQHSGKWHTWELPQVARQAAPDCGHGDDHKSGGRCRACWDQVLGPTGSRTGR